MKRPHHTSLKPGLFLSFLLYGMVSAQAAEKPTYTLEQCINVALDKSPSIQSAQWDIESSRGARVAVRAVLYPQASLTGTAGLRNEDLFNSKDQNTREKTREDWRGTVQVVYSLYSGGVNTREMSIADLELDRKFLQLEETTNEVIFRVKRSFNQVLFHENEIRTQQQIINLLEEETGRQKKLVDVGRASRFTLVRAEVRLANQTPQLIAAQNNLVNACLQLTEDMGLTWPDGDPQAPFNISGELVCPPVKLTTEQAVLEALARRPDPQRIGKEIEIAQKNAEIARASNIPRVEAFTQGTQRRDDNVGSDFTDSRSDVAFGLMGRWNIFDGFGGKGRAQQAEAQVKKLTIEKGDRIRRIEFEVRRAMNSINRARETLDGQEENVSKAFDAFRLARSSADAGLTSEFEVLQATVDLNEAQNIQLSARLAYHQALAELEKTLFTQRRMLASADEIPSRGPAVAHRSSPEVSPRSVVP